MLTNSANRSKSHNVLGFTLVELIVVITILVILGTIAFVSLSDFSGNARDGSRSSDLSSISKWLDMAYIKGGGYPTPDNSLNVTYLGGIVWSQGTFGDTSMIAVGARWARISTKPTDPLTKAEYVYSLPATGKSYALKATYENPIATEDNRAFPTAYASTGNPSITYIAGNYNGVATTVSTGGVVYILASPSIVTSQTGAAGSSLDITSLTGKILVHAWAGTSGVNNFVPKLTYSGASLPSTDTERITFASGIVSAYSDTSLSSVSSIASFMSASSSTGALAAIGGNFIGTSLGGNVVNAVVTNSTTTSMPDAYTKLLLHGDNTGSPGTFVDNSVNNYAITRYGNVTQTGSLKKFGNGSISFNGTTDYLSLIDSDDWNFGTGAFTVDLWANFNNVTTTHEILSQRVDDNNFMVLAFISGGGLWFRVMDAGVEKISVYQNTPSHGFVANTWYHLAVARDWNNFVIYRNGSSIATSTNSNTIKDFAAPLYIGTYNTTGYFFPGFLDEVRISKWIARWSWNFSSNLPNTPY